MADNTSEDLNRLIEEMRTLTKAFTHSTKANTKAVRQATPHPSSPAPTGDAAVIKRLIEEQNKLSLMTRSLSTGFKKVNDTSVTASKKFTEFSEAANHASSGLGNLSKLLGIGGIFGVMAKAVDNTTKTYQEMTAVGQSFGGSMLEMQTAAANAALPLDQFAAIIKKNSVVMATMGAKPFFEMSKALRSSMTDMGQLGMTSSQLNEFMGAYMETQRLYGHTSGLSQEKSVAAMKSLAIETQKASEMTGMSRENIMKGTMKAMQDETIRAKMLMMSSSSSESFTAALAKSSAYMSALPGTAGETLSTMLAQSVGRGSALLSDASQTFIDAGLFGVTDMMDSMAKKVASGTVTDQDQANFNRKFVAEGMKNMSSLQFQAATGNTAAKSAIIMISEMKALANKSPEDLAATSKMTKFMLNLSTVIDTLSGKIRGAFFKGLDNFMSSFDKFADSPAFIELTDKIGIMATRFGTFLGETLTPERLIAFGSAMATGVEGLAKFALMVVWCIEKVANGFGALSDTLGTFGAAVGIISAYFLAKFAMKSVGNLLAEKFTIGGNQAQQTGEAFAKALARYASGGALRVLMNPGGQGGPDLPERGDNRRNRNRNRNRNRRLPHYLPPDQHGPQLPNNHNLNQPHNLPNNQHGPRIPLDHPSLPNNQHGPHLPNSPNIPPNRPLPNIPVPDTRSQRLRERLNRLSEAGPGFRERSSRTIGQAIRHPIRTGAAGARRGLSAGSSIIRRSGSAIAGGARNIGGIAKGGLSMAKGLVGPGALVGAGLSVALAMAPDFKGKATLQSMAEYGAMGAMLGPVGAAVGAGVGAVVANWDDLSGIVSSGFGAITNFDYAGAFGKAASMLSPISDGVSWFVGSIWSSYSAVGTSLADGFGKIKDFDYAGALSSAASYLAPIGIGIGAGAIALIAHWGTIGDFASTAFESIKNFSWSGLADDAAKVASPISDKFNSYASAMSSGWAAITTANDTALGVVTNAASTTNQSANSMMSMPILGSLTSMLSNIIAPNQPLNVGAPNINTDGSTSALAEIKIQNSQIQKENSDLRLQISKLMDTIAQGANNTTGGLRDLIGEQRKGNQNLGTIAGNII